MIIGIDEANFSPSLAGDCLVVSLISLGDKVPGVRDSKKIRKSEQRELFGRIKETSIFSVVPANINTIDGMGIYKARNLAIATSLRYLMMSLKYDPRFNGDMSQIEEVIIDGKWSPRVLKWISEQCFDVEISGLVRGDSKVYEISAASVVARVYADALFEGWDKFWPGYNLGSNHGSPDQQMYDGLYEKGPAPLFRTHNYGVEWWKRILRDKYPKYFGGLSG